MNLNPYSNATLQQIAVSWSAIFGIPRIRAARIAIHSHLNLTNAQGNGNAAKRRAKLLSA